MRSRVGWLALITAASLAVCGAARAQGNPPDEPFRQFDVRLGILAHDVRFAGGKEGGADFNAELTSPSPVSPDWTAGAPLWAQWLLHPRLHLGVSPNLNGKTNQFYAGVTGSAVLLRGILKPDDAVEFNLLFGPALNDGYRSTSRPDRKSLGSNILFHVGGEITYRVTPRFLVGVYFDHSSNAGLARNNSSLNDFGLRVGYRF